MIVFKKLLVLAMMLAFISGGAAQLKVESYSFTMPTRADDKNPGLLDDPDFKKLTDGLYSRTGEKKRIPGVAWDLKANQKKPVTLRFEFPSEVKLDEVKIYYIRVKRSHGLKSIRLVGITESNERLPLGNLILNHPYERPDEEPANAVAVIKSEDDSPVKSAEVIIEGTGSFLRLEEVEFFGTALPPRQAASTSAVPSNRLIENARPGLRMYQDDKLFVLENDFSIYAVDPFSSGTVNLAYDKIAKHNMVLYTGPGQGYGPIFEDRFWPGDSAIRDMYRHLEYQAEIISDTTEKKQLRMSGRGKSGLFSNVLIEKLYTLTPDSSVLSVDISITNEMINVVPLNFGYWLAGGVQNADGFQRIIPGLKKVETGPSSVKLLASQDISSGWFGTMAGDKGLAVAVPYELLKEICFWSGNNFTGTLECKLGVYPIKAGESLSFSAYLCPFNGIGIPAKVTSLMAGGFSDGSVKLRIFKQGDYSLRLLAGVVKQGQVEFKEIKTVPLPQETFANISYQPLKQQGTIVTRAEVLEGGKAVFMMENSTVNGQSSGDYNLTPDGEKKPDASESMQKLNLNFNSMDVVTEHFNWARPYAGGKPKVLAVNFRKGGIRDMIELAQRFEMELTTNYIGDLWAISGAVTSLNRNTCLNELSKQLKNKFDVIMVSGDIWQLLPKEIADAILAQVENGAGLILCAPEGHPEALAGSFSLAEKKNKLKGAWKKAENSAIVEGIPFDALPPTRANRYQTTGKVLATVGGAPLLSEFTHGKGKVYAFSYAVTPPSDRPAKKATGYTRSSTLWFLPIMTSNDPGLDYKFHEYQMALIGRVIYDAAGLKSNISVSGITARNGNLELSLNAEKAQDVEAELTIRDKFSTGTAAVTRKLSLNAGSNTLEIAFPEQALQGLHFADLRLVGDKGAEWWGSATFEHRAADGITSVELTDRIYKKDETLKCKVVAAGQVTASLFDSHGNEFARASGNSLELPLQNCLTPACRLVIEVRQNGKLIDRTEHRVTLFQKPDPRYFQISDGWPNISNDGTQLFLLRDYIRRTMEYGINCASGAASEWESESTVKALRDCGLVFHSSYVKTTVGAKIPYDTKNKPKNKFELIRIPCLSKPGFKESLEQGSGDLGPAYPYGILQIGGPDESNMISEWDGCFSPDCQKAFREWLKKKYGTLDALNKSWQANYTDWNDIIAKTSSEVRADKSFAPWVDHRTFNDWNRADALSYLVRGINSKDPSLAYSLSGTSETNPVNAWDYYRLMPYLKALSSYVGEQTIQQRCFAPHKLWMQPWIGYDGNYNYINEKLFRVLMAGATGTRIYTTKLYVNPDYTLPEAGLELKRAIDNYRNGPAEVVMSSETYSYPIAFHYSPASIKVDWILNLDLQRKSATGGFKLLVEDAALNYDYVAYGQMEKEGIPDKYKVFILPLSSALSDREIEAIDKFVQRGGIVIADMGLGNYDQHGTPAMRSQLLKIFGIARPGKVETVTGTVSGKTLTVSGLTMQGLTLKVKQIETGIVPQNAQSLAEVQHGSQTSPGVLVNNYGKGMAIYLGAAIPSCVGEWQEMRYSRGNSANFHILRQFFSGIYQRAEIKPLVSADSLAASSIYIRQLKNAYICGIARSHTQTANLDAVPKKHTVKLNGQWHVYDLLNSSYLSHGDQFEYNFGPGTQSAFVLLPYKPEKINVETRQNNITLTLDAPTQQWTDHIYKVEMKDPSGKVNPAYSQLVFAEGGTGLFHFIPPLNSPPGAWTMTATEVITGLTVTQQIEPK